MKKLICFVISIVLVPGFSFASFASDSSLDNAKKAQLASRVKTGVARLGAGKSAVVRVALYDKTKYYGYITEIGAESFVVADAKTGATAPILYSEVKGIKGRNFSTGARIGIGIAIAAAVGIILAIVKSRDNEEGPGCVRTAQVGVPCPAGCVCIQ
ncbi:MAG: hypothetical protein ABI596_05860 [Pyrinomonadaceae bacterium]